MEYETVIGMEVHAQLLTKSKMFCGCAADYATAPPNTRVCPVCLSMPGALPVINQAAVEATILTGLALHCDIPEFSKFDRKNYPYPDLPKGYQISQYDFPLCVHGHLDIESNGKSKSIRIRRVHLEEDTAKLIHEHDSSLIDFNRAGVPLMEIVSEADMTNADEAHAYLTKLRTILRYLGVSTGNMAEGAMRCEANVSIRPVGSTELGTKVEVKNLNSFRAVRQAIAYEIERQAEILEKGERVQQVTMGWDERANRTVFQRSKEFAEDYRYFPEPDLPPLDLDRQFVESIRARLPELPDDKCARFITEYEIKPKDAALLVEDRTVADYFESVLSSLEKDVEPQTAANWVVGEIFRLMHEHAVDADELAIAPQQLAELLGLLADDTINATVAKDILDEMFETGDSPTAIVERENLTQISDQEKVGTIIENVLNENPKPLQQYLEGKEAVFGFFIGQVMQATQGQANVQIVRKVLRNELNRKKKNTDQE
ncbi:MAG: Asp-tRNA(Asn)/Glu-tRNA(Gln) amidotransferase subunit GatB [Chloroflexota bacterium]|nr:Asp-tRNA(Asn)/Glu-tRNA(Gln) amidotransferase subunit GatB [Chloroflexota bacterium]